MQQTEKYKLNLIERDDPFLPDALNDSTQKIEAALSGLEAYADAGDAAVISRVVELEKFHIACGTYVGTGPNADGYLIETGFTPTEVCIFTTSPNTCYFRVVGDLRDSVIEFVENGFVLYSAMNQYGNRYTYVAFGIDE